VLLFVLEKLLILSIAHGWQQPGVGCRRAPSTATTGNWELTCSNGREKWQKKKTANLLTTFTEAEQECRYSPKGEVRLLVSKDLCYSLIGLFLTFGASLIRGEGWLRYRLHAGCVWPAGS